MTYEEFIERAANRHSGRPFRGMNRRGWRLVGRIGQSVEWVVMRIKDELEPAARAFIEAVTDAHAQQWMVDLLVAVSLKGENNPGTDNANALQTDAPARQAPNV